MLRPYQYIFYKVYKFYRYLVASIPGSIKEKPQDTAIKSVAIMMGFFIFFLVALLRLLRILHVIANNLNDLYGYGLILFFVIIHYFIFLYKKNYLLIEEKFRNETPLQRKTGSILTMAYIIFCFLFFIVTVSTHVQ
jgi:hypothetical protein